MYNRVRNAVLPPFHSFPTFRRTIKILKSVSLYKTTSVFVVTFASVRRTSPTNYVFQLKRGKRKKIHDPLTRIMSDRFDTENTCFHICCTRTHFVGITRKKFQRCNVKCKIVRTIYWWI